MMNEHDLPTGWVATTIDDLYEIVGGGTPSTRVANYWQGDIPWITSADIHGIKDIRPERYISKDAVNNSTTNLIPEGSIIVVTRVGLGKVAIASYPLCFSQDSQALVSTFGLIDQYYILYYLSQAVRIFKYQNRGTTISGVTKKQLASLSVPLPPLAEQQRIVSKIEELFSGLDAGEAALRRVQKLLATYRQAVLKAAFSPAIHWKTKKVLEICTLVDGDRGPNYPKKSDYMEEGYCLFLSTKNVRPDGFVFEEKVFINKEKHKSLRKGVLDRGDVVITTRGTLGNVALYDDSIVYPVVRINSGMLIFRIKNEDLNPSYLARYITSNHFQSQIKQHQTGTAQPQLPAGLIKNFIVCFPHPTEQEEIVSQIEARLSQIDALETWCATELKRSGRLRQAILKAAFAGNLVPQDPNDEPASALLARIHAERAVEGRRGRRESRPAPAAAATGEGAPRPSAINECPAPDDAAPRPMEPGHVSSAKK